MSRVTYLYHSGFAVELQERMLIFDYYDPDQTGDRVYSGRKNAPVVPEGKQLIMFFSHKHPDHFQLSAVRWAEKVSPNPIYFLGNDIRLNANYLERKGLSALILERMNRMAAGGGYESPRKDFRVETLRSTDQGAAFLVYTEGTAIYHAGDLNDWRWEGESEEWNTRMARDYKKEIDKIAGKHFDMAFVPLDPRQEGNYHLGMDYFLQNVDVDKVFPMHMWDDYDVIQRYKQTETGSLFAEKIVDVSDKNREFS
ncbi:MAG: MBL fold metallo-hydrolase [Lachnospiraceae bacterium]|nr:MBL fold metallo-hydrolase [Lachnospiraceae bacterium]